MAGVEREDGAGFIVEQMYRIQIPYRAPASEEKLCV